MGTLAIVSQILLLLAGLFLIIVVLLQRGRGGGLAGAFGGMGGQSAFGTKAGDVFTRITIVIAIIWVVLAGGSGFFLRASSRVKEREFKVNEVTTEDGAGDVSEDGELEILTAEPIDESAETDVNGDETTLPETTEDESSARPTPEPSDDLPTEE